MLALFLARHTLSPVHTDLGGSAFSVNALWLTLRLLPWGLKRRGPDYPPVSPCLAPFFDFRAFEV